MPRLKDDSTRLVSFHVSPRLWERFQHHAKDEQRTASAQLRLLMKKDIERGQRKKAA